MDVSYIQHCGNDLSVVNSARVSFNKESKWLSESKDYVSPVLSEKDFKLIRYLARNKHISPFNHTFITLRVKAPLFVARQLQKHEYMPWNEISRRYVDDDPEFFLPSDWRTRPDNIKQGSVEPDSTPLEWFAIDVGTNDFYEESLSRYKWMLDIGIAPEQARMVLPQSMYTEWYWSGTLAAWAKMYNLRIDPHSQKETQDIAKMCGDIISPLFPVSWKALTTKENV